LVETLGLPKGTTLDAIKQQKNEQANTLPYEAARSAGLDEAASWDEILVVKLNAHIESEEHT